MRALVFDVDGTIADTEEAHRRAFNEAFRRHDLALDWPPEVYRVLLRIAGGKERLRSVGLAPDLVAAVHRTKTELYVASVARGETPLRPGIARIVKEAAARRVPLAIATTSSEPNVHALLRATIGPEAIAAFRVLACGDVVAAKKPAPDVYRHALAGLGVEPHDAVAIEDSAIGLAAAKAAGLYTVVTRSPWTDDDDVTAADLVFPHLGDPSSPLEGADAARAGGPFVTLERLLGVR